MKYFLAIVLSAVCISANPLQETNLHGGRIIGGTNTRVGEFNFVAAVYYTTPDGTYFCGGALLNNQWVLTAAHCVINATLITVRVGSNLLQGNDPNRIIVATDTYIAHPEYNSETLENDVGLIKFRQPIQFSSYVGAVGLPNRDLPNESIVIAMGWGQTSDSDASVHNYLTDVTLSIVSNQECQLTYGSVIKETMLCAGGNYNEGLCNGDLGGPLIEYQSGRHILLVGISSFLSYNGCETAEPSGFTRVWDYVDWIRENINA